MSDPKHRHNWVMAAFVVHLTRPLPFLENPKYFNFEHVKGILCSFVSGLRAGINDI